MKKKKRKESIPYWNTDKNPPEHITIEFDDNVNSYFLDDSIELLFFMDMWPMELVIHYDGATYFARLHDTNEPYDNIAIVATHTYKEAVEALNMFSSIASRRIDRFNEPT